MRGEPRRRRRRFCGFEAGSDCDRLSAAWYAYADAELAPEAKRWMAGLPRRIRFTLGGRRFEVTHGAPDRINRFVFASAPEAEKAAALDACGVDAILAGHCGVPFTQAIGSRLWHNAGVVGMPANDGRPEVWASLLEPAPGGLVVRPLRFGYDWRSAAAKMRARGLPEGYARALETGLWPNCDVLPPREAAMRGRPLPSDPFFWAEAAADAA